jgi:phosphoribosylglycinamide formyltransferase-1
MNLAFLASHNGSNMQAIIDACKNRTLLSKPCIVISNNRDSGALKRAESENIPSLCLNGKTHPDFDDLDKAICEALVNHGTDYVILAGYMKKIGNRVLEQFKGRILNIHPALLPEYGGKGMYGMNVHKAVIDAGEKESGVTVHIIDENYDTGPIVAQAKVPVFENDTPETLAERVLEKEHEFFVEVLKRMEKSEK